jgi:hypothetical protein
MTADNRSVHTDALATLGNVISDQEKRDAIHIAVEPVQAAKELWPGDHVYLIDGMAFGDNHWNIRDSGKNYVGIVDPFLINPVKAGDWFWLLVYPRQITSLRHVWEHPDFAPAEDAAKVEKRVISKHLAAAWLEANIMDPDYGDLDSYIERILTGEAGYEEYLTTYGTDVTGTIPSEFWDHIEAYSGKKVPSSIRSRFTTFSCTC